MNKRQNENSERLLLAPSTNLISLAERPLSLESRRSKTTKSNVRSILKADVQVKVILVGYRPKADAQKFPFISQPPKSEKSLILQSTSMFDRPGNIS